MRILPKLVGMCVALIGVVFTFAAFQFFFMSFDDESLSYTLGTGLLVVVGIGLIVGGQWIGNRFDEKQ